MRLPHRPAHLIARFLQMQMPKGAHVAIRFEGSQSLLKASAETARWQEARQKRCGNKSERCDMDWQRKKVRPQWLGSKAAIRAQASTSPFRRRRSRSR